MLLRMRSSNETCLSSIYPIIIPIIIHNNLKQEERMNEYNTSCTIHSNEVAHDEKNIENIYVLNIYVSSRRSDCGMQRNTNLSLT